MAQGSKHTELFDAFADDLLAERNARPLVIVGASKIDDLLLEMLRAFLLPKIAKLKEQDELLEGDAPLPASARFLGDNHRTIHKMIRRSTRSDSLSKSRHRRSSNVR